MSLTEALKEVGEELGKEALEMAQAEGKVFFDENQDDVKEVGEDAANQLLLWARFEFTDIPTLSDDPGMAELAHHEELLAKRDGVFKKVAELEEANAEAVARLKAKAGGFIRRLGMKLGQRGLKYVTMALIALI